jgi:hypothetical protein
VKIALAALTCSGTLLALLPTSASAAPVSGIGQSRGVATADNPLLQKVHRWWRRGWGGVVPITGTVTDTATRTIGLTILPTGRTIMATTRPITRATTHPITMRRTTIRTILLATELILPPSSERDLGAEGRGRD